VCVCIVLSFLQLMDSTNIIIPFDFPFAILEHRYYSDPTSKLVYAVADGQYTYGPLSLYQFNNDEKYAKTIRDDELPPSLQCKEFYIVEPGFSTVDAIEIVDENRGVVYVKEIDTTDDENDESMATIDPEPHQIRMKELFKEMTECKNEIKSLKSIVLSENRFKRSSSIDSPGYTNSDKNSKWIRGGGDKNTGHMSDDGGMSTPLRYTQKSYIRKPQQAQSTFVQRSVATPAGSKYTATPLRKATTTTMASVTSKYATPLRSTLATTKKVVLKSIKSSGYGQFQSTNNSTTTIRKQQQHLATLATPGRAFRK